MERTYTQEEMTERNRIINQLHLEIIDLENEVQKLKDVDCRSAWGWKVACIGLSIYILITTVL